MPETELGKSREDAADMPEISCHLQFSPPLHKVSRSGYRSHEDMLDLSPGTCHHSYCPEIELVKEIAALELEVLHLERYLLSLYRNAFDQCLATPMVKERDCKPPSTSRAGSPLKDPRIQEKYESEPVNFYHPSGCINSCNNRMDKSCSLGDLKKKNGLKFQHFQKHPRNDSANSEDRNAPSAEKQSCDSSRPHSQSLSDRFGSSLLVCVSEASAKLSEEIIRCISSIYKKLAEQPVAQIDFLVSPISSLSSSSTFSPQDTYNVWSPNYRYESIMSPSYSKTPKDRQGPYSRMLELDKIHIDSYRFNYAEKIMQNFRALIGELEAVDPTKMKHEEKLAFWINIHNALVMHIFQSFLAYRLRQNYMKSTSSIMKAAYNVGGISINAHEIRSSILGCQPHRPELRLQKLFSQSQKLVKGRGKHPYALNQQEALVYFALCMGAYSDPAVRIYTAQNVLEELEHAKDEFLQSNVSICKETKINLPKILQYYAKDAAMGISAILEMVRGCMPETQQKAIRRCLKGRPERCVEWSSYKSEFRYIIREDLTRE